MLGAAAFGQDRTQPADLPGAPVTCDPGPAAYPPPGAPPKVQTWGPEALGGWRPPPCAGWDGLPPSVLVVLLGSVVASGGSDALAARFGAVSTLKGLRYWSTLDRRWEPLVTEATALDGPQGRPRPDFAPGELLPGREVFFRQQDNRSSAPVTYRMRVLERTEDRLAVGVVNVSPVKKLLMTLFGPGELQASYFLIRLAGERWGFFSLSSARAGGLASIGSSETSFISRAVASYRHFTGAD